MIRPKSPNFQPKIESPITLFRKQFGWQTDHETYNIILIHQLVRQNAMFSCDFLIHAFGNYILKCASHVQASWCLHIVGNVTHDWMKGGIKQFAIGAVAYSVSVREPAQGPFRLKWKYRAWPASSSDARIPVLWFCFYVCISLSYLT